MPGIPLTWATVQITSAIVCSLWYWIFARARACLSCNLPCCCPWSVLSTSSSVAILPLSCTSSLHVVIFSSRPSMLSDLNDLQSVELLCMYGRANIKKSSFALASWKGQPCWIMPDMMRYLIQQVDVNFISWKSLPQLTIHQSTDRGIHIVLLCRVACNFTRSHYKLECCLLLKQSMKRHAEHDLKFLECIIDLCHSESFADILHQIWSCTCQQACSIPCLAGLANMNST